MAKLLCITRENQVDQVLMVVPEHYDRKLAESEADDVLDHHPEEGVRTAWTPESRSGWLRVERQVTVPFPDVNAALFVIRTYLYPFESLACEEQRDLRSALRAMPSGN